MTGMKKVTDKTEFIIGIDFGHGETSAAFYSLINQDKFDLDILPGLKVIKSAVAILEQEGQQTICVGDAAIANAPMAKDFQISFKKRPSEMSEDERNRMIAFMKGVYMGILDQHPDYKTREHVVYIARPSQDSLWKSEESAYLTLAEKAGIPVAGIQKESRAAYFRARTQPDSKIDSQVKKGVLIVDFGSSTIDFTYLNGKITAPIDDGCALGASEVERILLEYAMSHPMDSYMPEFVKRYGNEKTSNPYNQMLYKFREAKEAFYGKKLPLLSVSFDYGLLTSSEFSPIMGFGGIAFTREQINSILGKGIPGGYIERVRNAVESFKKEKLRNNVVACVYLTGGASRMDFVREIFMDVFGLDAAHCPSDENPSVIVSQGVAHLSYADIKASKKETELKKMAQTAIANFNWEENFNSIIRNSIKAKIISKAKSLMTDYQKGAIGEYLTLKDNRSEKGEYIMMQSSSNENGLQFVRNIRSLYSKFESEFNSMVDYDFVSACETTIIQNVIDSVISKLKSALSAFEYDATNTNKLKLSGLSATVTHSGAKELSEKFTGPNEGHIIYDAVDSCYPIMVDWNLYKDRWDSDRVQHYNYYLAHYSNIFTSNEWSQFLKNKVVISGIESAKEQTKKYIEALINDYVSYAKLAIFFK